VVPARPAGRSRVDRAGQSGQAVVLGGGRATSWASHHDAVRLV
jgi:hypothetical protein